MYRAQELSWYYFWIDYRQEKTNRAVDSYYRDIQRNQIKADTLKTDNTRIIRCLWTLVSNASLSSLLADIDLTNVMPPDHVLIYKSYVLSKLCKYWEMLRGSLIKESPPRPVEKE